MQYEHKHYQIRTENGAEVVGVSGCVVRNFRTEKQAKAWIDREWKLSQDFIDVQDWKAWYIGDDTWNVAHDGETIAKVKVTTSTEKVEDYTGLKKYRIIRRNEVQVTVRVSWRSEVTINDSFIMRGSVKSAIKGAIKSIKDDHIWFHVRTQLEDKCREADISEWRIIDAYDNDQRQHCANLLALSK